MVTALAQTEHKFLRLSPKNKTISFRSRTSSSARLTPLLQPPTNHQIFGPIVVGIAMATTLLGYSGKRIRRHNRRIFRQTHGISKFAQRGCGISIEDDESGFRRYAQQHTA
jgi:hypothetical protein